MSYGAEEKEAMRNRDAADSDGGGPLSKEEFEDKVESGGDTDETEDTDMSEESTQTEASGIEAEIKTIRGGEPLANLTCQHTGGNKWTVLSARSGSVDAYQVNLDKVSCTCKHSEKKGGTEACGHIAYVLLHGERTVPEEAYQAARVHSAVDKLRDVQGDVEALHEAMDEHRVRQLSSDPDDGGGTDNTDDDTPEPPTPEEAYEGTQRAEDMKNAKTPEEAADELQSAFDEVIDDMQVKTGGGKVWFQTGRDTPDDWPFPGVDSTFNAVTGAEVVTFVYESDDGPNHDWYDDKPGEWFKNALKPNEVEEYISEVLE